MQATVRVNRQGSEEIGLLHDAQELLFIDLAIAITISLINHFLQLFVCHSLAKLLGNTLQVLERDFTSFIIIEKTEGLEDLILWVAIQNLVRHHLKELLIFDGTTAVVVD